MILDTAASHPVAYGLLLAVGAGLGLPMGPAVLAAGALFCGALGLSLLTTALVSACCSLSATDWRSYSLAFLVVFTMVVQAGALGDDALSGELSSVSTTVMLVGGVSTAALALISGIRLRRRLRPASA